MNLYLSLDNYPSMRLEIASAVNAANCSLPQEVKRCSRCQHSRKPANVTVAVLELETADDYQTCQAQRT